MKKEIIKYSVILIFLISYKVICNNAPQCDLVKYGCILTKQIIELEE